MVLDLYVGQPAVRVFSEVVGSMVYIRLQTASLRSLIKSQTTHDDLIVDRLARKKFKK